MSKLRFILFFSIFLSSLDSHAQGIKRWTLCSMGKLGTYVSDNKDTIIVEATFGQCPGCTVISNGSNYIRQGFQQPLADVRKDTTSGPGGPGGGGPGGTGLPPCQPNDPAGAFMMDFTITPQSTSCGTYYNFEYTGDVKPNMKFGWDFSPTGVPRYANIKDPNKVGFISKGIKFIRLEAGVTCSKSITKTLNVTEEAFVAQGVPKGNILCKGAKTGEILLTAYGGTPPYNYSWSNNLSGTNPKNLGGGNYFFTVTDNKNCDFSSSVTIVEPKDSLKVLAKVKDETCRDTKDGEISLTIKGGTAPYDILWNDNANTPLRGNLSIGKLSVIVKDNNGCSASKSYEIKRYCDKKATDFPNTFSPNDDGFNDGWEFPGIDDFPNNKVEIYNRWGALVFSTTGYKSGAWKGMNTSGQPLPAGPYYYVIHLNDRDKTIFSGAVTIIR
jgi:gliding motility-associated-like protein